MVAPLEHDPVLVAIEADPEVDRWRPLVHWFLAIPHLLVVYALGVLQGALTVVAFLTVLFTARIPDGVFDAIVMTRRYEWRVITYVACLRRSYPPYDFTMAAWDQGDDPARLSVERPAQLRRFLPLVKWFLAIPHFVVLAFLGMAAGVAVLVGWVAILVTGRFPEGVREFVVGVYRWNTRVAAYAGLLTDRYPPFSLA